MATLVPSLEPGDNFHNPTTVRVENLLQEGGSRVLEAGVRVIRIGGSEVDIPGLKSVSTSWTAPGVAIDASTVVADRVTVTPKKLTSYVAISRESMTDIDGGLAAPLQYSISRSLAHQVDVVTLGQGGGSGEVPKSWVDIAAPLRVPGSADPYSGLVEAVTFVASNGGEARVAFTSPSGMAHLLNARDGAQRPLLADPSSGVVEVLGLKLFVSSGVTGSRVLVVDPRAVGIVIRQDADIRIDESELFRSDSIAVRATMRLAPCVLDSDGVSVVDLASTAYGS